MPTTIRDVKIVGYDDTSRYEDRVIAHLYSIEVYVHSDVKLCEEGLFEDYFIFYNEEGAKVEGRFVLVHYSHDSRENGYEYIFHSTTEINTPGDFHFNERTIHYGRRAEGWATY